MSKAMTHCSRLPALCFVHMTCMPSIMTFFVSCYIARLCLLLFLLTLPPLSFFFFLNNTPPPEFYPLPLHAALPIYPAAAQPKQLGEHRRDPGQERALRPARRDRDHRRGGAPAGLRARRLRAVPAHARGGRRAHPAEIGRAHV